MRPLQELLKYFDARLLILVVTTALFGFAIAHWHGSKARLDYSKYDFLASLAYEIGFGQALWAVHICLLVAGIIVATRAKSHGAKRLAVQLFVNGAVFAALSFAAFVFLFPENT